LYKEGLPGHFKALAVSAYKEQGNELVNVNSDLLVIIIMTKIILMMVINVFIFN
jgi:hypothetical protein